VIWKFTKNEFEALQRLNNLDEQVDSEVKQDAPDDAVAHDFSKIEIVNIVCKDEKGIGGGEDATFVKDFVIVRFSVLVGPELDDVDDC
jgi:hypothetical protein